MKTPRQKCLEMWQWLHDNPGKFKDDYHIFLLTFNKDKEYHPCWACYVADGYCERCPLYKNFIRYNIGCMAKGEPYARWCKTQSKTAAQDMIQLIKRNWRD